MNAVTITLVVSRANAGQCIVELYRDGHGDDMVEERADQFEQALKRTKDELLQQDGGENLPIRGTQPEKE